MSQQEFEHYLSLLSQMLKLTPDQRDAIADELRVHLDERLAELQQQGCNRDKAVRLALEEFGDASILANDFTRIVNHPHRRRIMQTSLLTAAITAMALFATVSMLPEKESVTLSSAQADAPAATLQAGGPPASAEPNDVLLGGDYIYLNTVGINPEEVRSGAIAALELQKQCEGRPPTIADLLAWGGLDIADQRRIGYEFTFLRAVTPTDEIVINLYLPFVLDERGIHDLPLRPGDTVFLRQLDYGVSIFDR